MRHTTLPSFTVISAAMLAGCAGGGNGTAVAGSSPEAAKQAAVTTRPAVPAGPYAEAPYLTGAIQLTFPSRFLRAGEAYFDHENPPQWIIFQAVPKPAAGQPADPFYSMYVAKLKRDASGAITGLEEPVVISDPGSYNTCGWFHPLVPGMVLFASSLTAPATAQTGGYSRDKGKYEWPQPDETRIVNMMVPAIAKEWLEPAKMQEAVHRVKTGMNVYNGDNPVEAGTVETMLYAAGKGRKDRSELTRPGPTGYAAECSNSPDGRHVLFAYRDPAAGDVDLFAYDTKFGVEQPLRKIVEAKGYDGGPFFSPDGKKICYRSDRRQNGELQLYVADLVFSEGGTIIGTVNERALTDQTGVVNWAPYWSRDGKYLLYASSAFGHDNYELMAIDVDNPSRAARVTVSAGFDGLPALSDDGAWLMWSSQRGGAEPGEAKPSTQLWIAKVTGSPAFPKP